MNIGLAADHAGFKLKESVKARLQSQDYKITDFGASTLNKDDDYPDFVIPMARAVARGELDRGIAICGSGVGACVAANKVSGIRAAIIHEIFTARQGVEDDNMNIICLGERVIDKELAFKLIDTFLNARFSGAVRHRRRLKKIDNLEKEKSFEKP